MYYTRLNIPDVVAASSGQLEFSLFTITRNRRRASNQTLFFEKTNICRSNLNCNVFVYLISKDEFTRKWTKFWTNRTTWRV